MTIRCLTEQQQNEIAYQYTFLHRKAQELGIEYEVSERTIYRVLKEKKVQTDKEVNGLPQPQERKDLPHLSVIQRVKCFFKAVFN